MRLQPQPRRSATTTALHESLIPENATRPGDDPIFALHGEAMRRKAAGDSVLNATLGALMEDDGSPSVMPTVTEALGRIPAEVSSLYAPIAGPPAFLRAVERDLFGEDETLLGRAVTVATAGGTGAIHHGIVNFLSPGETLLTSSYYWGPYGILAAHTRRELETFRMFGEDGTFDLDALETSVRALAASQGRLLLVLNTPCHNPTGYTLNAAEWTRIEGIVRSVAAEVPTTVLLDLAYAKFGTHATDDWKRHGAALSDVCTVLIAWSASKAFMQYGSRVGALVALHPTADGRERIANALSYSCRGTWSNCNHLGMLAITECLQDPDLRERTEVERQRLRELLQGRVEIFNELAAQAGLRYPRYEGGFFVSVFTGDAARTAEVMRERGVFVVPLKGAVRVGICATPGAEIPRLVEALSTGIQAAGGVPSAR